MKREQEPTVCRLIKNSYSEQIVETKNDIAHFKELPENVQKTVLSWLHWNLSPTKRTPLESYNSYSMKHLLEFRTGIYITNNQMKEAMLKLGFSIKKINELKWHFCVSKRSQMFIKWNDGKPGLPMEEVERRENYFEKQKNEEESEIE